MRQSERGTERRALRGFERLEPREMLAAQPIISEFMASNNSTFSDGFGQESDWIELTNIGDAPIDLQGYYLSDSVNNYAKWSFPTSTILNPGQYLIVFASDLNTIDPLGYHHTNYKLSADGEHVVLAAPDGTILSQFGPNGDDYPPQLTDISYGVSDVVVSGDSPASYLIPTNGSLGTSWTNINFDALANGFTTGKASLGYDTNTSGVDYNPLIKTQLPVGTSSVYVRMEFDLTNAAAVTALSMNLKYDDGVVIYINGQFITSDFAPNSPAWNSVATTYHDDYAVIAGSTFNLNSAMPYLQTGKNVLAIQLLNAGSGSSDLFLSPELSAQASAGVIGYLMTPTPGQPNSSIMQMGPRIDASVFTPTQPVAGQPIIVTANVTPSLAPVDTSSVRLRYRVMYNSEVQVTMYDDGLTAGDAVAGDGVYTAQIPSSAFSAGQMVRWYVTAADTTGIIGRGPSYLDPVDSPQYYGTVVVDPSVATDLPVIYWFVENPNAAATDAGTRTSLYIDGKFYDNVQVDLHGQSTTQPQFLKKSFNFDANSGLKFEFDGPLGRVSDFNLITNFTDKTYYRNTIAYELYGAAGGPALLAYPTVVYRNGAYYGLYDLVEEAQSEFLERVGLDPDGALYKMGNGFDSTTYEVEKKTRKYEDRSDLQQLVNTASLNTNQGQIWITDNLDLATWANYFAIQTLIANRDYGQKNYYLYRDTNNTEQWLILPWDMDLSFGHQWNPAENYFDDDLIWNDGLYVYMGGNHLMERLIAFPQFTEMYTRRLRTLMDEFYGPPGQNISSSDVVQRINSLMTEIGADALKDRNTWGTAAGMAYETPTQAVTRVQANFLNRRKIYLNSLSSIPASQTAMPNVTLSAEYAPANGNQKQEYIALLNNSNTAVDISGWTISGNVNYTFKGGTVIPANSTYYLVAAVAEFKARTTGPRGGQKLFIQGNYDAELNNTYGQLTLKNKADTTIATMSYGTPPSNGDYDGDGNVDGRDFLAWQRGFGSAAVPPGSGADGDGSGTVDGNDLNVWQESYAALPVSVVATTADTGEDAILPGVIQLNLQPAVQTASAEKMVSDVDTSWLFDAEWQMEDNLLMDPIHTNGSIIRSGFATFAATDDEPLPSELDPTLDLAFELLRSDHRWN
jgi:hypothetical protein